MNYLKNFEFLIAEPDGNAWREIGTMWQGKPGRLGSRFEDELFTTAELQAKCERIRISVVDMLDTGEALHIYSDGELGARVPTSLAILGCRALARDGAVLAVTMIN